MRRSAQRILAVVTGLVLGWYLAGMLPGIGASLAVEQAGEPPHAQTSHAADQPLPEHDTKHGTLPPSSHGGHTDHRSPHENDAIHLLPKPHDMTWFRAVVWSAAGLFVAALVLGIPALKLKGEEPPEPVAGHDNDHGSHDEDQGHRDSHAAHAHP